MLYLRTACTPISVFAAIWLTGAGAIASDIKLPPPSSAEFCVAVQNLLADTRVTSINTVFDNMPDYRSSKPTPDPLMIYQVVSYDDERPVMVSCKLKTADHLRSVYGQDAAGEQGICADITQLVKEQTIANLQAANMEQFANQAQAFVIDINEPYTTGREYLSDFQLSYLGEDGKIHFNSPGLQVNWDDWKFWIMPYIIRGQTYCHIPTVAYMNAVATGEVEPGTVMTTTDDVQATPAKHSPTRLPANN